MVTLNTLQTTAQYLFFLVSQRCLSVLHITDYINIYAKKNYYTQSSLDSKNVILQTVLLFNSLIKSTSPLKVLITLSEYSSKDLFKAFDTINYSILLKKLEVYGVNTTNLTWLASYLNGRKKYIKIT